MDLCLIKDNEFAEDINKIFSEEVTALENKVASVFTGSKEGILYRSLEAIDKGEDLGYLFNKNGEAITKTEIRRISNLKQNELTNEDIKTIRRFNLDGEGPVSASEYIGNIITNIKDTQRVFNNAKHIIKTSPEDFLRGIKNLTVGVVNHYHKGSNLSIHAKQNSIQTQLIGKFDDFLNNEKSSISGLNLFDALRLKKISTKDVYIELHNLDSNNRRNQNPEFEGTADSRKIAKKINQMRIKLKSEYALYGINYDLIDNYIFRQNHSRHKIEKMTFEKWYDYILDVIDEDKTARALNLDDRHANPTAWENEFRRMYNNIIEDSSMSTGAPSRIAGRRKIHFKNGDAAFRYHKQFSTATDFMSSLHLEFAKHGSTLGLYQTLGVNYQRNYSRLLGFLRNYIHKKNKNITDKDKDFLKNTKGFDLIDVAVKHTDGSERIAKLGNTPSQRFTIEKYGKFYGLLGWAPGSVEQKPWRYLREIDGTTSTPVFGTLATYASAIRAVEMTSSLGKVVLSSIPDVSISHVALVDHGIQRKKAGQLVANRLARTVSQDLPLGIANMATDLFKFAKVPSRGLDKMTDRDLAELGRTLGVAVDIARGHLHNRFMNVENELGGGFVAKSSLKLQSTFLKMSQSTAWNDTWRTMVTSAVSSNLVHLHKTQFQSLDTSLKRQLQASNINQTDWDVMREFAIAEFKNYKFLTSDALMENFSSRGIEGYTTLKNILDENINQLNSQVYIYELAQKINVFYHALADMAILTPGAREHGYMNPLGFRRGTILGEAMRFIMQFKSYPISVASLIWGRQFYAFMARDPQIYNLAVYLGASTAMGFISMYAKALSDGYYIKPDLRDKKLWMDALIAGGGGGIYGDALSAIIAESDEKFLSNISRFAAGPTFSSIPVKKMYKSAMKYGNVYDGFSNIDTFNMIRREIPFQNIYWLKPILDMIVVGPWQDKLNPNYRKNLDKFFERKYRKYRINTGI